MVRIVDCMIDRMIGAELSYDSDMVLREYEAEVAARKQERDQRVLRLKDKTYPVPECSFEEYAGNYTHPGYGDFVFEINAEGKLNSPNLCEYEDYRLEYIGNDRFVAIWAEHGEYQSEESVFTFIKGDSGVFEKISASLQPGVQNIIFRRIQSCKKN